MITEEVKKKLKVYRLSESEYQRICELLKREPNHIEWALFSALWSEHCSYKSSRLHLKKFAQTINPTVASASGENAGIIDIGYGERIAFKMESHNHPSFIEPFQGAATGVGGILRDIFTMGARPIALANYLCFGEIDAPRMKELIEGVVRGISSYGNCVGVPTVTGQTQFHSEYNENILVNAMAVGYFGPEDSIALSAAKGVGNLIVYVGAKTGKDGVHGAAMASESFGENNEAKKPNIQIGDPYYEKLLIESCLEVIQKNLVVAIQDMGAAGLTSSSFEMASKGKIGMEIHLDRVPSRDLSIQAEELLLSESQERMLLICRPNMLEEIQKHFSKWGLDAVDVGRVIEPRQIRLFWKEQLLTEIDPDLLVENAPIYNREFKNWQTRLSPSFDGAASLRDKDLLQELGNYKRAAKNYIYEQFDQRVGAKTAASSDSADIAVLRLPSGRGLAVAVGCRPELMKIDAYLGAVDAVAYPVLQMAVKGCKALAVTDCLNFANPERIEIMSEFVASVHGIRDASLLFQAPVISGNVSFYNETQGRGIISTPATGLVGIRSTVDDLAKDFFQNIGNQVYLFELENLKIDLISKKVAGSLELTILKSLQEFLLEADESGILKSSQCVGFETLAAALAKMAEKKLGIEMRDDQVSEELMFSQRKALYQIILEVDHEQRLESLWQKYSLRHCRLLRIGQVNDGNLNWGRIHYSNQEISKAYRLGFSQRMQS